MYDLKLTNQYDSKTTRSIENVLKIVMSWYVGISKRKIATMSLGKMPNGENKNALRAKIHAAWGNKKNKNHKNRFENIGLSDHDGYIVKSPCKQASKTF